jgi:undecaprenyl-diphosphatase
MPSIDAQILVLINHGTANALFDILMPALTLQGYLLVAPVLFFCLIQGFRTRDSSDKRYIVTAIAAVAIACLSVYVADIVEHLIKDVVMRMRPCRTIENLRLILPCPKSYSMPSGHSMSSFAFAVPLVHLSRGFLPNAWRYYILILASLIAFSRLYLGVHYPSDVLAGGAMGAGIGIGLSMLYEVNGRRFGSRTQ